MPNSESWPLTAGSSFRGQVRHCFVSDIHPAAAIAGARCSPAAVTIDPQPAFLQRRLSDDIAFPCGGTPLSVRDLPYSEARLAARAPFDSLDLSFGSDDSEHVPIAGARGAGPAH